MPSVPQGCPLSARQFECLVLLAEGHTYKGIAERLTLTNSTVRSHLHAVYRNLRVSNGNAAIVVACSEGWLGWTAPPQPPPVDYFDPLLEEHPFLAAYLAIFVASKWPARRPTRAERIGMAHALAGHRCAQVVRARRVGAA